MDKPREIEIIEKYECLVITLEDNFSGLLQKYFASDCDIDYDFSQNYRVRNLLRLRKALINELKKLNQQ